MRNNWSIKDITRGIVVGVTAGFMRYNGWSVAGVDTFKDEDGTTLYKLLITGETAHLLAAKRLRNNQPVGTPIFLFEGSPRRLKVLYAKTMRFSLKDLDSINLSRSEKAAIKEEVYARV